MRFMSVFLLFFSDASSKTKKCFVYICILANNWLKVNFSNQLFICPHNNTQRAPRQVFSIFFASAGIQYSCGPVLIHLLKASLFRVQPARGWNFHLIAQNQTEQRAVYEVSVIFFSDHLLEFFFRRIRIYECSLLISLSVWQASPETFFFLFYIV